METLVKPSLPVLNLAEHAVDDTEIISAQTFLRIDSLVSCTNAESCIGGRYAAWLYGLVDEAGSVVIYQEPNEPIPRLNTPDLLVRRDWLDRRKRAVAQIVSYVDAVADMVSFAYSPWEAANVSRRYLDQGGDPFTLRMAVGLRPGRVHEEAMLDVLDQAA